MASMRLAALATFQAAEAEADRTGFAVLGAYYLGMIGVLTADPDPSFSTPVPNKLQLHMGKRLVQRY